MYVSINKQLISFKTDSAFKIGFARKRVKGHFLLANDSAGKITESPSKCASVLRGPGVEIPI
jgi:hypothetical protein